VDGIRDHSVMLARALGDINGVTAAVHDLRGCQDVRSLERLAPRVPHGRHAMVVQYNPFSYGRWGYAPWLPQAIRRLRSARPGTIIVLLAHELFVDLAGPRNTMMGLAQRVQFAFLRALSDVVLTTTEPLAQHAGGRGRPPAALLPVGSNLPDRRAARTDARRALKVEDRQVVLGLLGTGHWSRMFSLLPPTIERLAQHRRLVVLNLGAGAPVLTAERDDVLVHMPGELPAGELAECLSALDLLLLPFADGVSTRRTTLMAGLQHAIPVVSTDGPSTDDLLRGSSAVALVPVDSARDAFVNRAEMLLENVELRLDLSRAGRELYDRHFAWPVLARRLLRYIGATIATKRA
jgi:glycosyltransferase involved in cell wall biosynthesis